MSIQLYNLARPSFIRCLKRAVVFFLIIVISACEQTQPVMTQVPPPAVSTYVISMNSVGDYREFVARTLASKKANLTARVILTSASFGTNGSRRLKSTSGAIARVCG